MTGSKAVKKAGVQALLNKPNPSKDLCNCKWAIVPTDEVERLISCNADLAYKEPSKMSRTALHLAANAGRAELVTIIANAKARDMRIRVPTPARHT